MSDSTPAYGLWSLVAINSAVFIFFAFSFFEPRSKRDWRTLGMFSAFIVALFTEMYGFPLTIYLLYGWQRLQIPGVDFLGHDAGHLLEVMYGWRSNPHFGPFHLVSYTHLDVYKRQVTERAPDWGWLSPAASSRCTAVEST